MSDTKDNGGPAFPVVTDFGIHEGMTLRDYFAAKAMVALIGHMNTSNVSLLAYSAYNVADMMLKAREQ